jgi:tmRNA-binding protein
MNLNTVDMLAGLVLFGQEIYISLTYSEIGYRDGYIEIKDRKFVHLQQQISNILPMTAN